MNEGSVFSALSERMERNKTLKYIIYVGIAAVALVIFLTAGRSSLVGGASAPKKESTDEKTEDGGGASGQGVTDALQLESRLEDILSSMNGVGRVKVMITFEGGSELVIATEDEESSNGGGSSKGSRPATLSGSGGESPIILTQLDPKIRGVIVIAEGASSISVKMDIIAAASTVLGVKESCVEVFEMNGK